MISRSREEGETKAREGRVVRGGGGEGRWKDLTHTITGVRGCEEGET